MNNKMTNSDYYMYIMAELTYKRIHLKEENIFPEDWYSIRDYKYKTEVIAEALTKEINITETDLYQNRNKTCIR